uniref:Ig-like domain-containing protein n=1 Tax=Denticeps clupeoides TaxID=299321 RepID=A0AAY4AGF7_9TELE
VYICFLLSCLIIMHSNTWALETLVAHYGDIIKIPCNRGAPKPANLIFTKWKYDKSGGNTGDLVKIKDSNITVMATDEYQGRVSIAPDFSLLISSAALGDQRKFTCMRASADDIFEYPVHVQVLMEILYWPTRSWCQHSLICEANPAANITWYKNDQVLVADGKEVIIITSVNKHHETGLSSTSSILRYSASKRDVDANFTCRASNLTSAPVSFLITYPPQKVTLHVTPSGPLKEGDNVTLRCSADGNPPPSRYIIHLKVSGEVMVEDSYTLTMVKRSHSGEYHCSPADNSSLLDSQTLEVLCEILSVILKSTQSVDRTTGSSLAVLLQTNASGEPTNKARLTAEPQFDQLKFSDSGLYECEVAIEGLIRRSSFILDVQGPPVIRSVDENQEIGGKHKNLSCEVEGSPKPSIQWSVNGTKVEEITHADGRVTQTLTLIPKENLTVTCFVKNHLGQEARSIDVSSVGEYLQSQSTFMPVCTARQAVGAVVGLILCALTLAVIYWIYWTKSSQGSWRTGENGTTEEKRKLEEEQKAKV